MEKAVIIDIDGTIADCNHRLHCVKPPMGVKKDWKKFYELAAIDMPYEWCVDLAKAMKAQGYTIIFLTAREGIQTNEDITRQWLDRNVGIEYVLMMRDKRDFRKDFIVKQEIYQLKVAPYYEIAFCIDDKPEVCNMYKSMGLRVLDCGVI